MMINKYICLALLLAFSTLITPSTSFAWHGNGGGDGYWNYNGSGRDYSYSQYIDVYYNPRNPDYSTINPIYIEQIPKMTLEPVQTIPQTITVNIPNRNGGFNAIVLQRSGSGFIGPQGEFYPEFPKVFQLEMKYGQ